MGAGPVSNNPLANVVPGADQSSNDALQGAKDIHRVSKDAAEGSGYLCVTWKNWVINKLGRPLGYLALVPSLPFVAVLDGISSLGSGVSLLFRKITRTESVVKKLPPMAEKQVTDVEKLTQKNAELSNEIAARKIEADQLNSAKAHADQQLGRLQQQNNQLGYQVAQQQNDNVQVAARAEKQAAAMNGQLRQLQQENGQLGHQMVQLQNEKTEAAARADSAESRVSGLTKAADQFNRERSELALKLQQITEQLDTARQRFSDIHTGDHRAKEKLTGEISSLKEQLATHQNQARVLGEKHQSQMRDLEIQKDTMMQELRTEITRLKEAKQRGEYEHHHAINDLQSRMSAQQELIAHLGEQEQAFANELRNITLQQPVHDLPTDQGGMNHNYMVQLEEQTHQRTQAQQDFQKLETLKETSLDEELCNQKGHELEFVKKEKYDRLMDRFKVLEQSCQEQRSQYDELIQSLKDDLETDPLQEVNDELVASLVAKQEEYATLHAQLVAKKNELEEKLSVLKERCQILESEAEESTEVKNRLENELEAQKKVNDELRVKVTGLQNEEESKVQQRRLEYSEASAERLNDGFEDEYKKLEAMLARQIGENLQLEKKLERTENTVRKKVEEKKQLQSAHDSLSRMTNRVAVLEADNKKLGEEIKEYRQANVELAKVSIKEECEKQSRDSDFRSLEFALIGTRSEQPDSAKIKEEAKRQLLRNQEKIEHLERTANFDAMEKDALLEKLAELDFENTKLMHKLHEVQREGEFRSMEGDWQNYFESEQAKLDDAEVVKS